MRKNLGFSGAVVVLIGSQLRRYRRIIHYFCAALNRYVLDKFGESYHFANIILLFILKSDSLYKYDYNWRYSNN